MKDNMTVAFMGSFNPPHIGHLEMIDMILAEREEMHLFVRYNEGVDLVSRETKQKWFDRISADRDNRVHVHMFNTDNFKGKTYNKSIFVTYLHMFESMLGRRIDEVWLGEDSAPLVEEARDEFPHTSFRITAKPYNSTAIRNDFKNHRDWLPDFVQKDLEKVLGGA